jgi:hypothetical protein
MTDAWRPAGARELRLGLAGLGSMGRNHLRILSSRPGSRLAAVADPVPDVLAPAIAGSGAEGYAENRRPRPVWPRRGCGIFAVHCYGVQYPK